MAECTCMWFPAGHRLPARYGLGAVALRYVALGYAVLPLDRGGKRPHRMLGDRGGVHHAACDPDQVMDWWGLDMAANVGVATGARSRLLVVDLDVKAGADGPAEWGQFLNGPPPCTDWPNTPVARTPSGGMHYWLRADGPVPERPGILPGVDVKGDGGYVVAPPSARLVVPGDRSGGTTGAVPVPYEWLSGCPHAAPDAPPWIRPWLESARPPRVATAGQSQASEHSERAPLDEALAAYLAHGIPQGQRNHEMYRIACGLYRRHPDAATVIGVLREVWLRTDHSGFGWREVLTCAESARRFVERSRERERNMSTQFMKWMEGR